jgi:hypothetical protein
MSPTSYRVNPSRGIFNLHDTTYGVKLQVRVAGIEPALSRV